MHKALAFANRTLKNIRGSPGIERLSTVLAHDLLSRGRVLGLHVVAQPLAGSEGRGALRAPEALVARVHRCVARQVCARREGGVAVRALQGNRGDGVRTRWLKGWPHRDAFVC